MSTIEKLRKDKMLAMKNKDKVKSGVISLIMSNILLEQKENYELHLFDYYIHQFLLVFHVLLG